MKKLNMIYKAVSTLLVLVLFSCGQPSEGEKLFKTFNQDENDFLSDIEFFSVLNEMRFFQRWNENNDQLLNEDEWSSGVNKYLGGYEVATVEEYGEWDLNADYDVSIDEFRKGLFEVVDTDDNGQVNKKEFVRFYKEGNQGSAQ